MPLNTQSTNYRDGETELTGLFAWDDSTSQKRPGILVIHGGAGLDDHAKNRATKLANLGYVTFACDLYGKAIAGDREKIMAQIAEFRSNPGKLCQRATAGLKVLETHPHVDGRFAAVGYCFGGMTALALGRSGADLAGVISVHGTLATPRTAESGAIKSKILVCHGALDPHVPLPQVNAFLGEMNASSADWQLIVYGGALHGFTHDSGPAFPGAAYHAVADTRSQIAIHNFLTELFGAAPGSPHHT